MLQVAALRVALAREAHGDTDWPAPSPDTLLVTDPVSPEALRALAMRAASRGVRVALALEPTTASLTSARAAQPVTVPVVPLPSRAGDAGTGAASRLLDIVGAITLTVVTLPLTLAAAIAIVLDSPGSPLFTQMRVGRDGQPFRLWKLRSMRRDAAPYARSPGDADPAVTRVGRLLRATGLDELPQLVNVLRGDMSLVGPRPEMPFITEGYTALERERLAVRPGLTGVWQLHGDRSRAMHEQVSLDLYYIAFRTLRLDLQLLAATVHYAGQGLRRTLSTAP